MSNYVILINPPVYDFSCYDLWLKPLGLLYVGALLEKHNIRVELIDCMDRWHPEILTMQKETEPQTDEYGRGKYYNEEIPKPHILKNIPRKFKRYGLPLSVFEKNLLDVCEKNKSAPLAVGITCTMTYWYLGVKDIIDIIRRKFPSVPIAVGGNYVQLCYEHAVKNLKCDSIFTDDGRDFLKFVYNTLNQHITFDEGDFYFKCLSPAYHLYRKKMRTAAVVTQLGCPYRCSYCASYILQPKFILKSPEKIFEEISNLVHNFGVTDIAFYDDALLINRDVVKKFLTMVVWNKTKVNFHTPNAVHAKRIDEELAFLLRRSGFKNIRLGFETVDIYKQTELSYGKIYNDELAQAIKNLKNAGFKNEDIGVYIMMNLPDQSEDEIKETIRFLSRLDVKIILSNLSPIPHTKVFDVIAEKRPEIIEEPLLHNKLVGGVYSPEVNYEKYLRVKAHLSAFSRFAYATKK